jgi:hypothetical protein
MENVKDLDGLIKLHEDFQNTILDQAFLTTKNDVIQRQLLKLFELIFRFKFI